MKPHTEALAIAESRRLIELEKVIQHGQKTFVEVGRALVEIKDLRLYKSDFGTFDDYCREKWGWKRAYAYQLIDGAEAVKSLSPEMSSMLDNSRQATELAKAPAESREAVLEVVSAKGPVTAKAIRDEVTKGKKGTTTNEPAERDSSPAFLSKEPLERPCVVAHTEVMPGAVPTAPPPPDPVQEPQEFKPRLKTRRAFTGWWMKTSKRNRAEFLPRLFTTEVVVRNKAEIRERVEQWMEHFVTEAKPEAPVADKPGGA